METQNPDDRGKNCFFDPSHGRRLKYHAAYAENPEFESQTAEAHIVSLADTYGNSPLVASYEEEDFGTWGGRQSRKMRTLASTTRLSTDLIGDGEIQGEFLEGVGRGINEDAMFRAGGVAPLANPNAHLSAHMRQAAMESEGSAPIYGTPIGRSQRRAMDPRYAEATENPDNGMTGYMTDRSEEGTPGMGDEMVGEERYSFDHRPFVEASPKAGHRTAAPVLSRDEIEQLRNEAGQAGDLEQVEICDRALNGDQEAMGMCIDVIGDARAQDDAPPVANRMAPGRTQARPTFRPQIRPQFPVAMRNQAAPQAPPRPTLGALQAQAATLLRQAEQATIQGQHGKAAVLEQRAENLIRSIEVRSRRPQMPPRRQAGRVAGYMESGTDLSEDNGDIGTGFQTYDAPPDWEE